MADQTSASAAISSRAEAFDNAEAAALEAFTAEFGEAEATAAAAEAQGEDDQPEEATAVDDTDDSVDHEQEAEETDSEPAKFDPAKWDGTWEALPEETRQYLEPVHKTMERGLHKNFRELAEAKKEADRAREEYTRKLESLQKGPVAGQTDDSGPPLPTADDSPEEQARKWDAREAWRIQRAVQEQVQKAGANDPKVQQLLAEREAERRVNTIRALPGYEPEVEKAMKYIAEQHPYYASLLDTDEGMTVLFHTAKMALEVEGLKSGKAQTTQAAAQKAEAGIQKKAGAAKGAIQRPGTRKATPVENYAKWTYADAEKAALEAWESGRTG